jgi:hypothetical protein
MNAIPSPISLDPASVLYFQKLAVRKRPIPAGTIPLPGFIWEAERARLKGASDKDMVKQFMSAIAYGWRAVQKAGDAAMVALIRVTTEPDRFEFAVSCANPAVIEPLDPKYRDRVGNLPDVDIRHRYAITDQLCPVVFGWQKAKNEILITNEYHFANPNQFLAIDRVGTTSGFLNFIGALGILLFKEEEKEFTSALPALLKDAMTSRADEWLRWIHHLKDERALFAPKRILVERNNPETWFYDYSGKPI